MHKILRMCHLGWLCGAVAAACLSACGSGDPSGVDAGLLHYGKPAKVQHAPSKAVDPTASMSTAVSLMKGPAPVNVKFQLDGRPLPGQPVNVEFALIPDASVVSISGKFGGDDGLKVSNGDHMDDVAKPTANLPILHTVTVVPSKDGIYAVTASLLVTVAGDEARPSNFAVPLIAGAGLSHLAAHAAPPPARH
jgi:hypothetical protein